MAEHAHSLLKRLEKLRNLKEGFMVKFALVRHHQTDEPHGTLPEEIRTINEELEEIQLQAFRSHPGSAEEANCLVRMRELEDLRFQLLSRMNGNRLEAYNTLSPHYPHL